MQARRGLTRADVMALSAVLVVLGLFIPPLLAQVRNEKENRAQCARNLRLIAQSMVVYSNENTDLYPYIGGTSPVTYDTTVKASPGKDTANATMAAIYKDKLFPNNPHAALWILVLNQQVAPKDFICPSDSFAGKPAPSIDDHTIWYQNFQDPKNVSYSAAYMWQEDNHGKISAAQLWRNTTDSSLPILCDMAPYLGTNAKAGEVATQPAAAPGAAAAQLDLKTASSPNHNYTGENVVFADCHSEWVIRPDIGQSADNIWAVYKDKKQVPIEAGELPAKLTVTAPPFDIVMVPTRDAKGDLK